MATIVPNRGVKGREHTSHRPRRVSALCVSARVEPLGGDARCAKKIGSGDSNAQITCAQRAAMPELTAMGPSGMGGFWGILAQDHFVLGSSFRLFSCTETVYSAIGGWAASLAVLWAPYSLTHFKAVPCLTVLLLAFALRNRSAKPILPLNGM